MHDVSKKKSPEYTFGSRTKQLIYEQRLAVIENILSVYNKYDTIIQLYYSDYVRHVHGL